ncbi:hypothetical protein [Streptomyces sp. NRRL F-5126]|uniref:hypothetical protein n=1 Tax=Streptomyces sp. NRRL F-5126 TaxID=1463857 RepID=UPI0004C6DA72|nr:hypothetical protein [Streptomyces sp. NRRL F-5126]
MTGKGVDQSDERGYAAAPWWAELGAVGSAALIAFGALVAVWAFFRLPGTPENLAQGYYQAAKIAAIGLVMAGSALLGRRRARTAVTEDTSEREEGA